MKLLKAVAVFALFFTSAQADQLDKLIKPTITINSCKYTRTGNSLDLALINRGYFVVRRGMGNTPFYTRYGKFKLNADNEIVTARGERLVGINPDDQKQSSIQISTVMLNPSPTTKADVGLNFYAYAEVNQEHSFSMTLYDAAGGAHVLEHRFKKVSSNLWQVSYLIDEQPVAMGQLLFKKNGKLSEQSLSQELVWNSPQNVQNITVNFDETTAYADPFLIQKVKSDGYPTGSLTGIDVTPDGQIQLSYSNFQNQFMEQRIAVAAFENPKKLTHIAEDLFMANVESGEGHMSTYNGLAAFLSGYLEQKPCLPDVL